MIAHFFLLQWKENLVKHQRVSNYYETDCGTNFVLLCQLKNKVGHLRKAYLPNPIKVLKFFTLVRIQKCLTQLQNVLTLLTINHVQAEPHI